MAFKMKAGKEGPMRKNFGKDISPMNKPLVGNQKNLPDHLKQKILDSPAKLKTKESPKKILGSLAKAALGPIGGLAAKALGNKKVRRGIGRVGGTMLQALGGPLGGMAGKAMGGMLMKKAPNKMKKKK